MATASAISGNSATGTLDLRPMSLSELLDRTFTLYRKNFLIFVGIAAPPQLLLVALNLALFSTTGARAIFSPAMHKGGPQTVAALTADLAVFGGWMFLVVILGWFAYALILGATTFAVSDIYLGRHATVQSAYRMIRPRALRVVDVGISILIRVFALFFVTFLGLMVVAVIISAFNPVLVFATVIAAYAAAILLVIRFGLRYGVCVPSLLLENLRARQAIKRSIELTKGRLGGMFLLFLIILLAAIAIALAISGPTQGAIMFLQRSQPPPLWLIDLHLLLGGIGQIIAGPLLSIALVLFYYDLRIRKEAFDLQVMMSGLPTPPSPADAPPAIS